VSLAPRLETDFGGEQIRNPKSEIRNKSEIQSSKSETIELFPTERIELKRSWASFIGFVSDLEFFHGQRIWMLLIPHLSLFRISDFGFRVSLRHPWAEAIEDLGGGEALGAERAQAAGIVSFGEPATGLIANERMVEPGWDGEVKEVLKEAMKMGRGQEIFAAGDEGDALGGVVDDNGKVVTGRNILPGEHHIAEDLWSAQMRAVEAVVPVKRSGQGAGLSCVEAPCVGATFVAPSGSLRFIESATGTGIKRALGAVRGACGGGDFALNAGARAETRVDEAQRFKLRQRRGVRAEVVTLPPCRLGPGQPEPGEVVL
jgi:hypothetical protein